MKKLILIAIAAMFCMQGFSQDSSMMKSDSSMGMGKMKSYITMTNGKVMIVKNDMPKELSNDTTLPDGTIVKKSGAIAMKNGQTKMLKEGERWYLGKKMSMNGGMDSTMMPKKDSMR